MSRSRYASRKESFGRNLIVSFFVMDVEAATESNRSVATKGMATAAAAAAEAADPIRLSLSEQIKSQLPLYVIRPIVEKHTNPEALLRVKDADGKTPLVQAIESHSPPEVIRYLIKRCPGAVQVRSAADDARSPLPLHSAVRMSSRWPSYAYDDERYEWNPDEHYEVIRTLVRQFPSAANVPTGSGWLPLHLALRSTDRRGPLDEDVIRILIEAGPRALRTPGKGGSLPLHCVLYFYGFKTDALLDTVELVVNGFPGALLARDDCGLLPLHVAARLLRWQMLSYLVRKCPQALRARTYEGRLPLHILMSRPQGSDLREIQFFIEQWPESVQVPDAKGNLPLHLTGRRRIDVVRFILEQHPAALRVQNDAGEVPLHIAASAMKADVIPMFLDECPESARVRDKEGRLPVHVAALTIYPDVGPFFEHWPDSVYEQDSDGRLPLHALLGGHYSDSILEQVRYHARSAPRSLLVADSQGRLPVHIAVVKGASLELVRILVETCPESLHIRDVDGCLPIHSATFADGRSNVDVIKFLARPWLGALQEPDNRGNWPLHAALSSAKRPETIRFLAAACPPSLRVRNNDGVLPLHLALAFLKKPLFDHFEMTWFQDQHQKWFQEASERVLVALDDTPVGTIRWLVDQCSESLQGLDAEGRLPLHLAAALDPALIPVLPLVRLFVERYPAALTVADRGGRGGFFPFQTAAIADAPLDVVYLLARLRPDRWISDAAGVRGGEPQARSSRHKRARTGS